MDDYGENRLQVRCIYDMNALHIQGVGPSVNRKYGIALELRAPQTLTKWLSEETPTQESPASKEILYAPMEAWYYSELDITQLLIRGSPLNHPDGAVLNVKTKSDSVKTLIEWLHKGVMQYPDVEEEPFKSSQTQHFSLGGEEE